jgi:magnesium chelatase family protein
MARVGEQCSWVTAPSRRLLLVSKPDLRQMTPRLIRKYSIVDAASKSLLENTITRLGLSARAYDRILSASRTLAGLEGKESVEPRHVSEAIQYRTLDRNFWA